MRNTAVRFVIGAGTGLLFLPFFQMFRLTDWLIGGALVVLLFGIAAALIGHFTNGASHAPAAPMIDGDNLTMMIQDILQNVEIEDNGMGRYTIKNNAGLENAIRNAIRKYMNI